LPDRSKRGTADPLTSAGRPEAGDFASGDGDRDFLAGLGATQHFADVVPKFLLRNRRHTDQGSRTATLRADACTRGFCIAASERPNAAARTLVTGRSRTIGIATYDTTLYGPASTLAAIERAAHAADYYTSIVTLQSLEHAALRSAVDRLQQRADGILVVVPLTAVVNTLPYVAASVPLCRRGTPRPDRRGDLPADDTLGLARGELRDPGPDQTLAEPCSRVAAGFLQPLAGGGGASNDIARFARSNQGVMHLLERACPLDELLEPRLG
jgi:hypothetical protein